ncbi:MAG TPA: fluoride efflux transporter CrcB [Pseudomonadota bacterium]|nr:fluoride efflux transporter CrcB [Pseudomonadota bacterium]
MLAFLLVTAGSALGGFLRYAIALLIHPRVGGAWPLGTLLVNVVGCFVLSLVNESVSRGFSLRPELRLLLTTGFCGGFTTYSTFNHETVKLVEEHGVLSGGGYAATTCVLCLLAHVAASILARRLASV